VAKREVTFRERLGGRWAISLRAYLISVPISIVLAILVTPEATESLTTFGIWFAISVFAILVTGLILLVADKTLLRDRRTTPAPIWMVVLVDVVAFEARTVIFISAIDIFNVPSSTPTNVRLVSGMLLATVWFPALSYAFDSWERYSQMRDQLIAHFVAEEVAILKQEQVIEVLRLGLVADINAQLDNSVRSARDSLSALQDAVAQEHGGELAVSTLLQINNDSIRRLSKELWNERATRSQLRFIDLIKATAQTKPFRPVLFLIPVGLSAIALMSRRIDIGSAFLFVISWFAYISTVALGANFLCKKFQAQAFRIYLSSLGLLSLSGILVFFELTTVGLDTSESVKWSFMASMTATFLMPWFSSGSGIAAHRTQIINQLQKSIDQTEIRSLAINGERLQLNRQISTYLHGTVQANLTAAILRLQQSIGLGDRESALQALGDARKALDLEWNPSLGTEIVDLNSALHAIAVGWKGFVDISILIEGDIPQSTNAAIREIFIEAINNGVRHGESDAISIGIREQPTCVDVCIINNGHPLEIIETGLGTDVLNTYAAGNWSRSTNPVSGTTLRVQLQK